MITTDSTEAMFFESNAGRTVEKISSGSKRFIINVAFALQASGVSSPEQQKKKFN